MDEGPMRLIRLRRKLLLIQALLSVLLGVAIGQLAWLLWALWH